MYDFTTLRIIIFYLGYVLSVLFVCSSGILKLKRLAFVSLALECLLS